MSKIDWAHPSKHLWFLEFTSFKIIITNDPDRNSGMFIIDCPILGIDKFQTIIHADQLEKAKQNAISKARLVIKKFTTDIAKA